MKYGLNQWARVSSLLVRKSPKQCKQRWYEWLDPQIKKTSWTREEEEKLLHLAKVRARSILVLFAGRVLSVSVQIMPTQWRSIAGCLEGRTPTQCLQHYEKLLDQAQGKDGLEDDPRRLRPGEIDPNPEVKPALPDPVDFDEDEKEMLQEARARLANTKGKKAKRKAREKTLDEAKRLAALQKRRELKAAGIHMPVPPMSGTKKKKRTKMIDVMAEIPFHKEAPAGFYDTSKEEARETAMSKNPRFKSMTLQRMEGERMQDVAERQKKKDNESMKKLKQDNLPVAMAKISKLNDTKSVVDRPALNLPTPQITNTELDAIAKAAVRGGVDGDEEEDAQLEGVAGVTRSLMPRVEQTPSFTPMRTPLAAAGVGTVQREAQFLAAMSRETQTPLVGGAGPAMSASEFAAPGKPLVTPNVLKTPMVVARTGRAVAAPTPLRTPASAVASSDLDDESGLSKRRKTQGGEMVPEEQEGPDLFASLSALPAPKNEYRIVVPSLPSESEVEVSAESQVPVDAADVRNKHQQQQMAQLRAMERMQSRVLLEGLPRAADPQLARGLSGPFVEAVARLIAYDNAVTPLAAASGKSRKSKRARESTAGRDGALPPMEQFSEQELQQARRELEKDAEMPDADQFAAEWEAHSSSLLAVPGKGFAAHAQLGSRAAIAAALKAEHDRIAEATQAVATKCQKLEAKVSLLHQGYAARAEAMGSSMSEAYEAFVRASIDLQCFRDMQGGESSSGHSRLARLEAEVAVVQTREEALQREYVNLRSQQ